MNLIDMATLAAERCRRTDPDSIARAARFIAARYAVIWRDALWLDSLYQFNRTLLSSSSVATADKYNTAALNGAGIYLFPEVVQHILAVRSPDTSVEPWAPELMFRITPDQFDATGTPLAFHRVSSAVWQSGGSAVPIYITSNSTGDTGATVTVDWIDEYGVRQRTQVTPLPSANDVRRIGSTNAAVVERISKPTTNGDIILCGATVATEYARAAALSTAAPFLQRIRFIPAPQVDTAFKALVKKQPLPLETDYDVPELTGCEDALMAFAQGDLMRFLKAYSMADSHFTEAQVLLQQLKAAQSVQEANGNRFLPQGDFGGDFASLINLNWQTL